MKNGEKFTVGTPVMCWNGDNMEHAKMRMFITLEAEKFSVLYPGYDGNGYVEYYDYICNLHEYSRYIRTPNYAIKNANAPCQTCTLQQTDIYNQI